MPPAEEENEETTADVEEPESEMAEGEDVEA